MHDVATLPLCGNVRRVDVICVRRTRPRNSSSERSGTSNLSIPNTEARVMLGRYPVTSSTAWADPHAAKSGVLALWQELAGMALFPH